LLIDEGVHDRIAFGAQFAGAPAGGVELRLLRDGMPQRIMQSARMPPLLATTGASAVIPGRREAASPESKKTGNPDVLDSGLAPEPVIGPAQAGRTRWARPGMTSWSFSAAR
jgi:hypothetical protein